MRDIIGKGDYVINNREIIDALLASPWKEISEDLPKDRTFLVTNSVKDVPEFCYYQKIMDRWTVTDIFSEGFTLSDLRKKYTHWMEIPPVD